LLGVETRGACEKSKKNEGDAHGWICFGGDRRDEP
jgi:hypothetical protein